MSRTLAILDAGPIISFHQIGRLHLLHDLFTDVVTAPVVVREVAPSLPILPDWIAIHPVEQRPWFVQKLGPGERAVIALAI